MKPKAPENRLSACSLVVNESATLAIAARAKRMLADGIPIVSLSTGEPDFPTPDVVKAAAMAAIDANFTHYTQSEGIPELRAAAARKFSTENGIVTDPSEVLISSGGKQSLFNVMMAILNPGDEVLIPVPYWVSYPEIVRLLGGVPVFLTTKGESRYKITPRQIEAAVTPRTRLLLLNSPSNPTGVMYTRTELEAIAAAIAGAGIYVISDELYEKITYDGHEHFSIGSVASLKQLAITVNGVSKAYSMTGWRIGFMRGPADVIAGAARIQSQSTSNPCSVSQKAALAALTLAAPDVERMRLAFSRRKDLIVSLLSEIPDVHFPVPDGAFYIFADISAYLGGAIPDSTALASYLLSDHHVATVPGSAFGLEGTIRLSYACSDEDIREGVKRFREGLMKLKGG